MGPWLLFDTNYLCHRAFYSTGGLSHEGRPTGMFYGVFQTILEATERFGTPNAVFCFDSRVNNRKELLPSYKEGRNKTKTKEEQKAYEVMLKQIGLLRRKILPWLGFKNVFIQRGFEADDLIAVVSRSILPDEKAIIVSSDHDLFQLLCVNVSLWNPNSKKITTESSFYKQWGIPPAEWVRVKAIAGCSSDNIPGVPGVGEKTAVKYIKGELKATSKAHRSIESKLQLIADNMKLVRLPFVGINQSEIKVVEQPPIAQKRWERVFKRYGMTSLVRKL